VYPNLLGARKHPRHVGAARRTSFPRKRESRPAFAGVTRKDGCAPAIRLKKSLELEALGGAWRRLKIKGKRRRAWGIV